MRVRGLSTIVATVMIISLTVIIGALLAAFVVPYVRDTLTGSTSCTAIQDYYAFDGSFGYNCYTPTYYTLSITERADQAGAGDVVGFNLILQGTEGASTVLNARTASGPLLILLNGTDSYPGLPGPGNVKTYRYTGSVRYTQAHLTAVLASGKSCEQREGTVTLRTC